MSQGPLGLSLGQEVEAEPRMHLALAITVGQGEQPGGVELAPEVANGGIGPTRGVEPRRQWSLEFPGLGVILADPRGQVTEDHGLRRLTVRAVVELEDSFEVFGLTPWFRSRNGSSPAGSGAIRPVGRAGWPRSSRSAPGGTASWRARHRPA